MKAQKTFPAFEFLLVIFSLASAWYFNSLNLHSLQSSRPEQVRAGLTVITADDASYLIPPGNYLLRGEWKDNFPGKGAYIQRPPGYGLVYLICRVCTRDPATALGVLRLLQLFLFAFSVWALYKTGCVLFGNHILLRLACLFYGLSPIAQGFLFYTLTEGLTPALLIIFVWLLVKFPTNKLGKFYWSAVVLSFILLIRPFYLIFLLLPILFILHNKEMHSMHKLKISFLYLLISISPLSVWLARNYQITAEFTGLHPIYYKENNSMFRNPHKEIGEFAKCWGQTGEEFHQSMQLLWESGIRESGQDEAISLVISKIPSWVTREIGREPLEQSYRKYIGSIRAVRNFYLQGLPVPEGYFPLETQVLKDFSAFRKILINHYFFQCQLLVPVRCYLRMAMHSNLSMYIFQQEFRGSWWMEVVRFFFAGIHGLLFVMFLPAIYFFRSRPPVFFLCITLFVALFYLAFFQRMIEERYTLPLLPFLLLISAGVSMNLTKTVRIKN